MKTVREQVLELLIKIEKEKSYAQLSLKSALEEMEQRDKALATEIFYGTLKYQIQLDYYLNQYAKTPVKKMKPLIRNILRLSLYQMLHMDKIPVSAVINEAVKIVKKRKMQGLSGFVNGVLRQIDRDKETLQLPDSQKYPVQYLAIHYAFPEWLIKMWLADYGQVETEKICEALNKRAIVCGRYNSLRGEREETQALLLKEGFEIQPGQLLEEAFYLKKVNSLQNSTSFQEGRWTVQDESAMLVAHVVQPQPGQKILDMCSAPGGKSMHMAALMQNKGEIICCDIHPHKLELIEKNAERLGIDIMQPTLQDGALFKKEWEGKFDRVLLDAPCSGLGIMKRKPDIRLNKSKEALEEIASIQKTLFKNALRYLKEEGLIIYSTCTISTLENEKLVRAIMETEGLELVNIVDTIPTILHPYIQDKGMIQILPYMADTDGFFIACLRKRRSL